MLKILFIVRFPNILRPTFTTTHLAFEAIERGHEVYFMSFRHFTQHHDGTISGRLKRPYLNNSLPSNRDELTSALWRQDCPEVTMDLSRMDVLFLRNNPAYIESKVEEKLGNPALYFCRQLKDQVRVINDPDGLFQADSKLFLLRIPQNARPKTLVSRNEEEIKEFLASLRGPAILKPLKGFGGDTVFYVRRRETANTNQYIESIKKTSYVMAQEYISAARTGDKRILLLDGELITINGQIAAYKRVSAKGDIRNNIHIGGVRRRTELTSEEVATCRLLTPLLRKLGLWFVGIDMAGGKILEINVFTPGGVHNINELYGINVGVHVITRLEALCQTPAMLSAVPAVAI